MRRAALALLFSLAVATNSSAQIVSKFFDFNGTSLCHPIGPLIQGDDGNLYGVSEYCGSFNPATVFKITPQHELILLYAFCTFDPCSSGSMPRSGLALGSDGNFYGTTQQGGSYTNCEWGCGTVFRITPSGVLTTLHRFDQTDGASPQEVLVEANDGNFYGTTQLGGLNDNGTVYRVSRVGDFSSVHSFNGGDGSHPTRLTSANDGNIYGTATNGGGAQCGALFKLTLDGIFTTVHSFEREQCNPYAVVTGGDSQLYGTTYSSIFRATMQGEITTLRELSSNDGKDSSSALLYAADSYFYGTTLREVSANEGTLFRISSEGAFSTLHNFCSEEHCADGKGATGDLITGVDGKLYGTTLYGGSGGTNWNGIIYAIKVPDWVLTVTRPSGGEVTSSDGHIACSPVCSGQYYNDDEVILTAKPSPGWIFNDWRGCDSTQANVCKVTMHSSRTVSATFTVITHTLTIQKSGNGLITSRDGHINCG